MKPLLTKTGPNVVRMESVIRQITDHPETHNQRYFAQRTTCGTAYCFAGWALALEDPNTEFSYSVGSKDQKNGELAVSAVFQGEHNWVEAHARVLLGLTTFEVDYLFAPLRTLDELTLAVKEFGAGRRLADFDWIDGVPVTTWE